MPIRVNRNRPIKVYISDEDRASIERLAKQTQLSLSDYLRRVGLGYKPRSVYDLDVGLELAKLNGDLGRLGGLLKNLIANNPGTYLSNHEIQNLLEEIRGVASEVRKGMQRL